MVTTKTRTGRIDPQEIYNEVFGNRAGENEAETRAARRDVRRAHAVVARRVHSYDDRAAAVRRRVRAESSRNRKQSRNGSRANAEINREIGAHEQGRNGSRANAEINREIEAHEQGGADRPSIRSSYGAPDFPRWYRRKL